MTRPSSGGEAPALGMLSVLREDGRTDAATDPILSTETLLSLYRDMCRLREVDRALVELQRSGKVAFHSSAGGQEAVVIGAAAAIEASDWVFPAAREGGILLSRGLPLARYLAQAFGSVADLAKGRQMPGHQGSRAARVVTRSSSVAAQLPQAVGVAWAARKAGARLAVVAFVGEGGTSSPDFHAALNFAGVFRTPCIVICQNNQFALSTPASRQTASVTFAVKGTAYGVPGVRVDGSDLLAVHRAVTDARVRASAGDGPTLLECVTAPRGPNLAASPGGAPCDGANEPSLTPPPAGSDPIARFRKHLVYIGALDDAHDAEIFAEVAEEIRAALAQAEAEAAPAVASLFEDVYAELPWHLVEQSEELISLRARAGSVL